VLKHLMKYKLGNVMFIMYRGITVAEHAEVFILSNGCVGTDAVRYLEHVQAVVTLSAPRRGDSQASSAPSSQQPSRYIPHRCPPGFDKITDQEYNNWFLKDVVQRSPVSVHSTSALNDEILILTPISNSAKHLQRYFENICSLVYPHRLVSIVLGEDSSTDTTVETAQQMTDQLGSYFQRVELVRLPLASSSL